jgi:hypothetical protein
MVSEDSGCLHTMDPAIPAASVHGVTARCRRHRNPSALRCSPRSIALTTEVKASSSCCFALRRGFVSKEWDDPGQKVGSLANHVYQRRVGRAGMVLPDAAAAEASRDQVQDPTALRVLTDVELRDELPPGSRRWVPLDGDVERSLPVDETRDVGIQPFLLIGRT